uniref:uncharacterized protein LOC122772864 isoform X1 n=1 Tax=Solea senegalensis TaxID=28829 RepID=UPI001CD8BD09|nr:uncharacterized protein LOC122772864 isoform X1 [Solea senegalensis]
MDCVTSFPMSDHAYLATRQSGPHITCQLRDQLPKLEKCSSCCSLFHCPFCSTRIFKPRVKNKVLKHLEGHVRRAVQHKDYTIFKCNLHCQNIAHFHCPSCTKIFIRRDRLLFHLKGCANEVDEKVPTANPDATDVQKEPDTTAENMQDDILFKVTESGDDLENVQDKEKKEQHLPLPLISTSFSLLESCPNNQQEIKRKRQAATEPEISPVDAHTSIRDEDELFLLSLLPSLKRLTIKKRMEVRMKFQQVLYTAEFED